MVRARHPAPFARRVAAAALIALGFAGCATTEATRVPALDTGIESPAPADGAARNLVLGRGTDSVAVTIWTPETPPRATILAVHGFADYGPSTFADAAQRWRACGIETIAYDQRGFGRNPSNRRWPGSGRLIDDLAAMNRWSRDRAPERLLVMVGHSMGGAVALAALGEGKADADAAVLLAPALWGGPYLNPLYRVTARIAATLLPDRRWTGEGLVRIQASDNIDVLRRLSRDPLYVGYPSSREFVGLIALMDRALDAAPQVTTPTLALFGAKDEVVPEAPIRETVERLRGPRRYERIESGWHLLLRDLEARKVQDLIARYVLSSSGRNGSECGSAEI